jgi:L-arabinokinase
MQLRSRILFALSSHGLGHVTRSLAIARELREAYPAVEILLASAVPRQRLERELPPPFGYRAVNYEPGTLQRNCFELDVAGTRAAYARWFAERPARLAAEREFLQEQGVAGVVSDIPALPVCAAGELGLPAVGVGNFTWDWILAPLLKDSELAWVPEALAADYARGTAYLRLPFSAPHSPFPRSELAPLVHRRARLSAVEVRRRLGLPAQDPLPLVVVCPGGWDPDGWTPIRVRGCSELRLVGVGDLPLSAEGPLHAFPHQLPAGVSLVDLVAAADLVVSKPGYGIASECLAHRVPLVMIERPDFPETPVLAAELAQLAPCTHLSLEDFFAGRWEGALRGVLASATPWAPPAEGGARQVARRIAQLLGLPDQPV